MYLYNKPKWQLCGITYQEKFLILKAPVEPGHTLSEYARNVVARSEICRLRTVVAGHPELWYAPSTATFRIIFSRFPPTRE
jgi:hypothetical protein